MSKHPTIDWKDVHETYAYTNAKVLWWWWLILGNFDPDFTIDFQHTVFKEKKRLKELIDENS